MYASLLVLEREKGMKSNRERKLEKNIETMFMRGFVSCAFRCTCRSIDGCLFRSVTKFHSHTRSEKKLISYRRIESSLFDVAEEAVRVDEVAVRDEVDLLDGCC